MSRKIQVGGERTGEEQCGFGQIVRRKGDIKRKNKLGRKLKENRMGQSPGRKESEKKKKGTGRQGNV